MRSETITIWPLSVVSNIGSCVLLNLFLLTKRKLKRIFALKTCHYHTNDFQENEAARSNSQKVGDDASLHATLAYKGFHGRICFRRAGGTCRQCLRAAPFRLSPGSSCALAIRGRSKAAVAHVAMAWIRMSSCMSTKLRSRPSIVLWRHSMTVTQ